MYYVFSQGTYCQSQNLISIYQRTSCNLATSVIKLAGSGILGG